MVKNRGDLKFFALTALSVFLAIVFASSVLSLGLVVKQESVVLSEGGGVCLSYELFNSKPTGFTAGVSVSDGLAEVFDSGGSPEIAPNTPRDEAVPVEVCFQTPSDLVGCSGNDVDFTGNVIFTEGGAEGGATGSVATLSVPVPMTVRVDCSGEGGSSFSLLWFIIALILLIIVILLIVRRSQARQMAAMPANMRVKGYK